jgi:hypothetical protein
MLLSSRPCFIDLRDHNGQVFFLCIYIPASGRSSRSRPLSVHLPTSELDANPYLDIVRMNFRPTRALWHLQQHDDQWLEGS